MFGPGLMVVIMVFVMVMVMKMKTIMVMVLKVLSQVGWLCQCQFQSFNRLKDFLLLAKTSTNSEFSYSE